MPTTSTSVKFGFYAMAIKANGVPSANCQPFTSVLDLTNENFQRTLYSTYEKNYWLLDGNFKFVPADTSKIHLGLISMEMSGADGAFTVPPVLTVAFSQTFSTNGLTLRFAPETSDWANSINVQFYNADNILLRNDVYTPTGYEFSTLQGCAGFTKIQIVFNSTNNPYRYARVSNIDYGNLITFSGVDVKDATVVEQINPVAIELPVNTLDLNLFSNSALFDITNPAGDYFDLQNRQALDVYENINSVPVYIGRYYLAEWENKSDNEIEFKATDILGVLDSYVFYGGLYTAQNAAALIGTMLDAISVQYAIDPDITDTVTGWIPVCTYREALQQICLAIGAYVTAARSNAMQFHKININPTEYAGAITKAEKGLQQTLSLKALVTGVEVLSHDYTANTETLELYNGSLPVGNHRITFNEPAHTLTISGGSITSSDVNYAIIAVAVPGTVVLSGLRYTDAQQVHGVYNAGLDPNITANVLSMARGTLISSAIAETVAQRLYDYYQQRYWQKVKLFAPTIKTGDAVLMDTLNNKHISGIVEKLTINLTGGFTAQAEITGVITA